MAGFYNIKPLLRTFIILGTVGAITTAATFAALQSQNAVLSSNTISTTTAFLLVSNDSTTYNNTKTGFTFSNITPGGAAQPASGYNFFLKNTGTANLAIKVAVSSTPTNLNGVDLSKVFLNFTRADDNLDQTFTLKSLIDSFSTGYAVLGDSVNAATVGPYNVKVSMAIDAYNGSNGATISGVDLVFSGLGT
jgi:hypothetical protein